MGTVRHCRRLHRLEVAEGIAKRRLVVIDLGTFNEGEVDDEMIEQMKIRELERRAADGMVLDHNCDVVVIVRTIVSTPDRGESEDRRVGIR